MQAIDNAWSELIVAVVSAVLGWFAKHFSDKRRR